MKRLVIFLLSVVTVGLFVYPSVVFAEVVSDEEITDPDISLDDVDFLRNDSMNAIIQPRGIGGCLSDERLGRVPPGYCRSGRITVRINSAQRKCLVNLFGAGITASISGNVARLVGGVAISYWKNCRYLV
ncbi:hypothetical protein IGK80_002901 [Enterococcus sp. DIV0609]|uniref:hypothetical protein n=1 Tax=Enterococcus TaxID=1350 RepID=UPI003CC5CE39